jgi:hypothetical protein
MKLIKRTEPVQDRLKWKVIVEKVKTLQSCSAEEVVSGCFESQSVLEGI